MNIEFKINEFEGPLDLLLHLIKESKMDIMNIEIEKMTNTSPIFFDQQKKIGNGITNLSLSLEKCAISVSYFTYIPKKEHYYSIPICCSFSRVNCSLYSLSTFLSSI